MHPMRRLAVVVLMVGMAVIPSAPQAAERVEQSCGGHLVRPPQAYDMAGPIPRTAICAIDVLPGFTSARMSFSGVLGWVHMTVRDPNGAVLVDARCDLIECEMTQSTPAHSRASITTLVLEYDYAEGTSLELAFSDAFYACVFDSCTTSGIAQNAGLTVESEAA